MKNFLRFALALSAILFLGASLFPEQAQALAHLVSPAYGPVVLTALVGAAGVKLACVILPIEGMTLDECPNAGGLTDLFVIRRRDIKTWPAVAADGVTLTGPIVPIDGSGFVKWDFASDTGEVNHKSSGDAGNQSVVQELNTNLPRGSAEVDAVIAKALNGDFILIGRDSNGNPRLAGDKNRGMKFDYDYKSGKKGTDKNGTDFKFAGEGFTHPPYYYTAAIPMKAAGAGA